MVPSVLPFLLHLASDLVRYLTFAPLCQVTPTSFELVPYIENVYQSMIAQTGGPTGMLASVELKIRGAAGIGALLYIFSRLIGQISRNESIDFFPLLRPFAMMLLIALAPRLCDTMDALGNDLLNVGIGQKNKINEQVNAHFEAVARAQDKKIDATDNTEDTSMWSALKDATMATVTAISDLPQKIFTWFLYLIQLLLQTVFFLCYSLMYLFSVAYRLILRLGAPLVFVAAIFPGFTGNLVNWFAKYLNFVLLPFVSAMYGTLSFGVLNAFMDQYDPTSAVTSQAELSQVALMGVAYIGVLIMCIIGYFQVPSMTEMLISVGGVGALAQGAQNAAKQSKATARATGSAVVAPVRLATAAATAVVGASMRSFGGGGSGTSPASAAGPTGAANTSGPQRQTVAAPAAISSGGGGMMGGAASGLRGGSGSSGSPISSDGSAIGSGNSAGGVPSATAANIPSAATTSTNNEVMDMGDPYERPTPPGASMARAAPGVTNTTDRSLVSQEADPYDRPTQSTGSTPNDGQPIDRSAPSGTDIGSVPDGAVMAFPDGGRTGNPGTIRRTIPAAMQRGRQVGSRVAGIVGGSLAGAFSYVAGGNGIDERVKQSFTQGQQRAATVGGAVGAALFGTGMAIGEVGRFGYNLVGGTVSNYKAITSRDGRTGKRASMPIRYRSMVDRNRKDNQAPDEWNPFTA